MALCSILHLAISFTIFAYLIPESQTSNILFYSIVATPSHHLVLHPLALRLSQTGHNVTYISSFKIQDESSNITYIYPQDVINVFTKAVLRVFSQEARLVDPNPYSAFHPVAIHLCEVFYDTKDIQLWLNQSLTFDLVIVDNSFNECGLSLAYKFKAPHIIFTTCTFNNWQWDVYGMPAESSWIPDLRLNLTNPMGFWARVVNTVDTLYAYVIKGSMSYYPALTEVIKNGLKDTSVPSVEELMQSTKLMLINSHIGAEYARSFPPFVVPVGGIHVQTNRPPLSKDIETFISACDQGFIYVSFGTGFQLSDDSKTLLFNILGTKFPEIGFIFQVSGQMLSFNPPKNIHFVSWAPQQSLLVHPKILAFMSHCGLLSVNEAVHYGVPVVGVPGFADQDYNADVIVQMGAGIRLEVTDLREDVVENAIRQIVYNPKYRERMKTLSTMFRDRPMAPLDTATWWTEYVLRNHKNGDLSLLKPLGIQQSWFVRRQLDVYAFMFLVILLGALAVLHVISKLLKVIFKITASKFVGNSQKIKFS